MRMGHDDEPIPETTTAPGLVVPLIPPAAIDERDLHDRLESLAGQRDEIVAAIDFLLLGY